MLTMKTYASVAGGETGSIWIVSAPPALGAADRAVLLVQTVAALGRQRLDRDKLAAAASDRASAMTATIANVTCGEMLD
jgi:hypothetical protein